MSTLPTMTLAAFLSSLAAGSGTFLVVPWFFGQLAVLGVTLSRKQRFYTIYALSFALAGGAYGLLIALGYTVFTWDDLFYAGVTAFATSQALWGIVMKPDPVTVEAKIIGQGQV